MANKRDFYEILGLKKGADAAAVKKAYRKLAKRYHPDTNKGNASFEEKFKEITEAYEILSDQEKKKLYDEYGMLAFDCGFDKSVLERAKAYQSYGRAGYGPSSYAGTGQGPSYGFGGDFTRTGRGGTWRFETGGGPGGYQEYHFSGDDIDLDDILGGIFGDRSGRGSGGSGRNTRRGHDGFGRDHGSRSYGFGGRSYTDRSLKGQDVHAGLEIGFDEAVHGCDRMISYQDEKGQLKTLQVHIPAGIDTGKKIRLAGRGAEGTGGGSPGDLYIEVTVKEKAGYERKGRDVYTSLQIPYTTAVFGGEIIVPTLYGDVRCRIREGTQSGSRIRLKGKGIAAMNQPDVRGDQYVTIQIQVPRSLNSEAKRKLREYQKAI